jgi:hypothetical protein
MQTGLLRSVDVGMEAQTLQEMAGIATGSVPTPGLIFDSPR